MKNILSLVILAFGVAVTNLSLKAADQPPLNENLKVFKPYLGNWSMHWTENGQPMTGKATVKTDAGGNTVTLRVEALDKEGKPVFSHAFIYYWQAETRSLAEVDFLSDGSHGSNVLVSQTENKLVWQGQRFGPDGKPSWGSTELVKTDENSWTGQFVRISFQGAPVPDSPKFNFTRAR